MLPVLMLFLIPIGGGIPAGVLLARSHAIAWPVTMGLYFVSDVILAFLFEPVLRLLIAASRRIPPLARFTEVLRQAMTRTAAQYGGGGAGPFALIMIAFGVDPMTGRAAAAAAGHGFLSGWTIAITGDMIYFTVIMVATLRLNSVLGDPNRTMALILAAMFFLPMLVRRLKSAYASRGLQAP
ncbi:MAG: hypothetical protein NTY77_03820 [Elusimicrobia bacterium]|nr:hypothetical protein [Elusimicrobiota bacterium]